MKPNEVHHDLLTIVRIAKHSHAANGYHYTVIIMNPDSNNEYNKELGSTYEIVMDAYLEQHPDAVVVFSTRNLIPLGIEFRTYIDYPCNFSLIGISQLELKPAVMVALMLQYFEISLKRAISEDEDVQRGIVLLHKPRHEWELEAERMGLEMAYDYYLERLELLSNKNLTINIKNINGEIEDLTGK